MLSKMTNYITDGGINFYEELMKNEEIDENNVCLLSNLPLDLTHIELPCSHKFNYIYIFNEVRSSKKPNALNIGYNNNYSIHSHEIMCPYCRKRFDLLLPPSKNIQGTTLLKNVNRSNKTLNIKCKCENSECKLPVCVTDIGYSCMYHYKKHIKNVAKGQKNEQTKIKKSNKETSNYSNNKKSCNTYTDSSMNVINTYTDSSMNVVYANVDLIYGQIIDLSELKYKISKKYTITTLKEILKTNKFPVSGKKDELIQRIINNKLYKFI